MKRTDLLLTLSQRLLLLLCFFIICYLVTAVCSYVLGRVLNGNPAAALRISAVVQDLLTFVIPAVGTAVIVCRKPAALLCLTRIPHVSTIMLVAFILFVSVPAQEAVIYWNYHIKLPASMAGLEESARTLEHAAFVTLKTMLANTSYGALIVNLLIIGIFAGLSEELLFRGCFQRLLITGGVNRHLAVWIVAFSFSALHFQLFGFVPRVLLGAYFGYLLLWSGSIWIPVTAHVLNNMMFVLTAWRHIRTSGLETLDNEPVLWSLPATVLSIALTAIALYILWRRRSLTAD